MKTLFLLRHAKAEASSPDGRDLHRELAARGRKDAGRVGKAIRKLGAAPEVILCSPSTRTRSTVDCLLEKLKLAPLVVFEESIYEATAEDLLNVLRAQSADRVMIVGHNPGLEQLAALLLSSGSDSVRLPTCGFARFDFEIDDWRRAGEAPGRLEWVLNPEVLGSI
jgi:phosphohistidine phosphatase